MSPDGRIHRVTLHTRPGDPTVPYVISVTREPPKGAVYYVSPDGDDDSLGDEAEPWQTWRFAIEQLRPGDTLVAADGTWSNSGSCVGFPQPCLPGTDPIDVSCDADNGWARAIPIVSS